MKVGLLQIVFYSPVIDDTFFAEGFAAEGSSFFSFVSNAAKTLTRCSCEVLVSNFNC